MVGVACVSPALKESKRKGYFNEYVQGDITKQKMKEENF